MELNDFLALSIGSVIYNKKDKDLRRTASQFLVDRLDQYNESGAAMWTRPLFDEQGFGRDIPLAECGDWEPIHQDRIWEVEDQKIVNRFLYEQQVYIFSRVLTLKDMLRHF